MNHPFSLSHAQKAARVSLPLPATMVIILFLWLGNTGLQALVQTGLVTPPFSAVLEFIPGLLGLTVLCAAGFSVGECFLQIAPLTRRGALLLAITLPLLLPVFLIGKWTGWNPVNALVYAPAGAIAQVIFFRCALFPVFLRLIPGRPHLANLLAALLHGLWHVGPIVQGAAWYGALPVMLIPFLAGLAWNEQIRHDRTVLWAAIYHILVDQGIILFWS